MSPQISNTAPTVARASLWRERLLVALISLVVMYGFFYEYLPPHKRVFLWSDIGGYHYPLHRFAFAELKQGRLPLWDSSIYCGITLIGNVQAALLYPPMWLTYAAVWTSARFPFKALEVFTFAHVWMALMLCYMWLRGRTGRLAALLGAAVFACTGYMMWQTLHPGVLGAMTWMPLGLWGIDEFAEGRGWRRLWKVAAASALAFLAGYPASWIVIAIIFAAYALASRRHVVALLGTSLAIGASALLAMVELLPSLDARSMMMLEVKYGPGAYSFLTLLRSFFLPNWFDFNPGHPGNFEPGCLYLYLGLPALFALGWAIRRHRVRPYLQPLAGLAVALLFANPPLFLLKAVERVPALNYTMQPPNFYSAVAAMAALITALGLNDFLSHGNPRALPKWVLAASAAAISAWSLRQLWIWRFQHGAFATGTRAVWMTAVALLLFAMCLWCVRQSRGRRRTVMTAFLLFAAATDYKVYGSGRWFNAMPGDLDKVDPPFGIRGIDDDAYRAMRANRQYREVTDSLAGIHPVEYRLFGLTTPEGFDPFLTRQYKERIERWVPFQTNRLFYTNVLDENMLQHLGVRYVLVRRGAEHDPNLAADPKFKLVGTDDIYCHVYEYLHARAPYHWERDDAGTVSLLRWDPDRREFLLRSQTGGRFVLVEQFFPGWRATVDGQRAVVERWDGAFQAIRVGAGEHRVRFEFRPVSLGIGAAISLLALTALLWVVKGCYSSGRPDSFSARQPPSSEIASV